jgi:GT2 family glycosyltransferase
MSRLSIVIVSFNVRHDLERALESLHTHPPAIDHEVVLVDNASSDGTVESVRARFPGVSVLESGSNVGFAAANNLGIRSTASPLLLLLNPDTLVPEAAIDRLVGRLEAVPDAVAAGPRLVDATGEPELSFGREYSPRAEAWHKLVTQLAAGGFPPARTYVRRLTSTERVVDWISGACLLVRRDAALGAGLLDERYFMYAEDVDFCVALRRRGGRILFTPAAEICHLRGRSATTREAATRAAWERSHLAYYRKHLPGWAPLLERYLRMTGGLRG